MTHHPRFGSGSERSGGSRAKLFKIAYRHGVELFLSGHQHDYERFGPMTGRGRPSRHGVVQFVSGAGGRSLEQSIGTMDNGSRYFTHTKFGVLKLKLRPTSYRFAFKTVDGATPDSGSRRCV
jgi:hypothetical protein